MSTTNTVPTLKRLLKVTLVSRNAFARAAETVPSADLAEILVERALDLAHMADALRDQLARTDGAGAPQSVEHAQVFVVTVLEARRAYRLAMTDAMRKLMETTPASERELPVARTDVHPLEHHQRRLPGVRRMVPPAAPRRRMVNASVSDRPALRLVHLED